MTSLLHASSKPCSDLKDNSLKQTLHHLNQPLPYRGCYQYEPCPLVNQWRMFAESCPPRRNGSLMRGQLICPEDALKDRVQPNNHRISFSVSTKTSSPTLKCPEQFIRLIAGSAKISKQEKLNLAQCMTRKLNNSKPLQVAINHQLLTTPENTITCHNTLNQSLQHFA